MIHPATVQPTPRVWTIFCDWLGLSPVLQRRWWRALAGSQYSTPLAWYQALLFFDATTCGDRGQARHLMQTVCAPATVVAVLEALCHEGRLTRAQANELAEAVLRYVDAQGRWY